MTIDEFQNAIINITGREHDGTGWMKCLNSHACAQVSLQRPFDGVLRVTLAGKRHWIDFRAFPVDTSGHVDVAEGSG